MVCLPVANAVKNESSELFRPLLLAFQKWRAAVVGRFQAARRLVPVDGKAEMETLVPEL